MLQRVDSNLQHATTRISTASVIKVLIMGTGPGDVYILLCCLLTDNTQRGEKFYVSPNSSSIVFQDSQ